MEPDEDLSAFWANTMAVVEDVKELLQAVPKFIA
jgi:hypothetical protein